jgi:hypothetical protein
MRRFLLSGSFLSVVLAGFSLAAKSLVGPRDWRLILLWGSWVVSLVLAISAINNRNRV